MSRQIIDRYASDLFDLVEVNGANVLSTSNAVETLRLVNTALSQEYAVSLVDLSKRSSGQNLDRHDFSVAVQHALRNTDVRDAVLLLRGFISRLRQDYRKKFFMTEVRATAPPASLAENPTAIAFFREFFDTEAHGNSHITRAQLRELVSAIVPTDPGAAAHCVKAALSEDESDMISFFEFMTVMQPVTARQSLSDLVDRMRPRRATSHPSPDLLLSEAEMERYRRRDAEARRPLLFMPTGASLADRRVATGTRGGGGDARDGPEVAALKGELHRLRRENAERRQELLQMQTRGPSVRIEEGDRVIEMNGEEFFNEENASLRGQLAVMKEELHACQAKIDMYENLSGAHSELRLNLFPEESIQALYPDEIALATRYTKLLRLVERQREALGRPAQLFLLQLDAIAQGYQSLYRQLRESVDGTGAANYPIRAQSVRKAPKAQRQPWID